MLFFRKKEKTMFSYDEMVNELEIGQDYLVTFSNNELNCEYGNGIKAMLVFLFIDEAGLNFYHKLYKKPYRITESMMFRIEESRTPQRFLWKNDVKHKERRTNERRSEKRNNRRNSQNA